MSRTVVRCPGCKEKIEVDREDGPSFECSECGKKFRLGGKPAVTTGGAPTKKRPAPPPRDDDDDDDDFDDPAPKPVKRKKKKKKSAGLPPFLLPAMGGLFVVLVIFGSLFFFRKAIGDRMSAFVSGDAMKSIPADADVVLMCRPKALSGASGSTVGDILAGGGRTYAPMPPSGFGFEPGHVDEVLEVRKGPLTYKIMRFIWKARPDNTTQLVETHRGMSIYKDVLKSEERSKTRYVVVMGSDVMMMNSVEDGKAAIDRMLDAKGPTVEFPPKTPAGYHAKAAPPLKQILCDNMGPDMPQPKLVRAITTLKDYDYYVTYYFEYDSPAAAAEAKEAIEKARKDVILEIGRIKTEKSHEWEIGANPYSALESWLHETIEVEGNKLTMKKTFSKMAAIWGQRLIGECLTLGEGEVENAELDEALKQGLGR